MDGEGRAARARLHVALPPWASAIAETSDRPRPAPPEARVRRGVAAGEPLEGVLGEARAAGPGRRRGPDPRRRRRPGRADTVTVVPGGRVVPGVAEQVGDDLVQPLLVPGDRHRLVGQVELPRWRARRRVRRRPTRAAAGSGRPRRARAAGRRPAGPAAAGPRRGADIRSASVSTLASAAESAAGSSGVRRRELGVPVDGGQRRTQLVRGVGDELADLLLAAVPGGEGGLDVVEQGVQRGADLADLGALVGELVGHPLGRRRSRPPDSGSSVTAWAVAATSLQRRSWRRTTSVPAPGGGEPTPSRASSDLPARSGCVDDRRRRRRSAGRLTEPCAPSEPCGRRRGSCADGGEVDAVHLAVGRARRRARRAAVVEQLVGPPLSVGAMTTASIRAGVGERPPVTVPVAVAGLGRRSSPRPSGPPPSAGDAASDLRAPASSSRSVR